MSQTVWVVEYCESPSDHWVDSIFSSRERALKYASSHGVPYEQNELLFRGDRGDYNVSPWEVDERKSI